MSAFVGTQRDFGTSLMASCQNSAGFLALGKRQLNPMIAMDSF